MPSGKIRIVTDSSAQFLNSSVRSAVTVIPLSLRFGTQTLREDAEIDTKGFLQRLATSQTLPQLIPPSVDAFKHLYTALCSTSDRILSIHVSRSMHSTWANARAAASALIGGCEIAVVDSQTIGIGQGLLVEYAVRLAQQTNSLDEVVRELRRMIARTYAIFCVDSIVTLRGSGLVSESQAIIGGYIGIKPIITIEEGELIAMEKVRTMSQAIDHFVEFVTEFTSVEHLVIVQSTPAPTEYTRTLQERLAEEFANRPYTILPYKPSMGTFLGTNAMGIVVFESESSWDEEALDDDLLDVDMDDKE
ncbi:MAG TPA: DegV family protein [Aggregatilineales bacterium]|nr:DegV family protein [Aggregatilineales bacterium]